MPVSLDLRKAHKVRRHGDLLAIYTWVNDARACAVACANFYHHPRQLLPIGCSHASKGLLIHLCKAL